MNIIILTAVIEDGDKLKNSLKLLNKDFFISK